MPPKLSNSPGKPGKGKGPARNPTDILGSAQFRCSIGKEMKPASAFSKREWNLFEHKVKRGMKVSINKTGMTCREHKGEPSLEYRCQGPCDKVKPISEFSKNGRTKGVYWCQSCVAFQLSQETEANVEAVKQDAPGPDTHGSNHFVMFSRTQSHAASVLGSIDADVESSIGGVHLDQRSQVSLGLPPHLNVLSPKEGSVVTSSYAPSETDDGSIAPGDSSSQIGRTIMPPHLGRVRGYQSSVVSGSSRHVDDWDFSGRQARQSQAIEEDPFEDDDDDQASIASRSTMRISVGSDAHEVDVSEFLVDAPAPRPSKKAADVPRAAGSKWAKPRRKVEPAPLPTLEDFERPPQYDDDSETELP